MGINRIFLEGIFMKSLQKLLALVVALTFMCLFSLHIDTSSAFASSVSSASSPTVDIAALQKTCAVLNIDLHGVQHTITCLKARTHGSVQPNLS